MVLLFINCGEVSILFTKHQVTEKLKEFLGPQLAQLYPLLGEGIRTKEDLSQLKEAYRRLRKREEVRNTVMAMQKKYALPLAPNDSLGRTVMKIRLKQLLNRNPFSDDEPNKGGSVL